MCLRPYVWLDGARRAADRLSARARCRAPCGATGVRSTADACVPAAVGTGLRCGLCFLGGLDHTKRGSPTVQPPDAGGATDAVAIAQEKTARLLGNYKYMEPKDPQQTPRDE